MIKSRVLSILFLTAMMVACGSQEGNVELTKNQHALVAERIAPDGQVMMAGLAAIASNASGEGRSGESIYNLSCMSCHDTGALGAPKKGDVAAWASRLEQGIETVYANAINGIRGMPARGLCMDCSDDEIMASIDYIIENSQ